MVQNDISIKDGDYDSDPILLINKQSIEISFCFFVSQTKEECRHLQKPPYLLRPNLLPGKTDFEKARTA